tara:strand:+ start:7379 stop:7666 length:288 start_codon:yes stop_codon:yes gene_type:complete
MAQIFWEQIRNELPDIGEFLTGSLNISGSFSHTGSVYIDLDGIEDEFNIRVAGKQQLKVNTEGVLQIASQSITPTPIDGGLFYSSSNEFFFGFKN